MTPLGVVEATETTAQRLASILGAVCVLPGIPAVLGKYQIGAQDVVLVDRISHLDKLAGGTWKPFRYSRVLLRG